MKVIKKYKIIRYATNTVNDEKILELKEFNRYSYHEYDSEDDAIRAAYELNPWAEFMIVPIISFDNSKE